mmetsp:Transcript_86324/g.149382  ORF Transcript_86324/g.149382 Transcript_86324/m.149382 type:complete len:91 (+) Transcript_86324:657-929(+)
MEDLLSQSLQGMASSSSRWLVTNVEEMHWSPLEKGWRLVQPYLQVSKRWDVRQAGRSEELWTLAALPPRVPRDDEKAGAGSRAPDSPAYH